MKVNELLIKWQKWEADVIKTNKCWEDTDVPVKLTTELFEEYLLLQEEREQILNNHESKALHIADVMDSCITEGCNKKGAKVEGLCYGCWSAKCN